MRLRLTTTVKCLLAVVILVTPLTAAADTVLTGNVGRVFSGDLEESELSYGGSIGFMGEGPFGFEVEGTYSPDVFGETEAGSSNISTLMGNLLVGIPLGQVARIYATGGLGIMKFSVPDVDEFFEIDQNDFGFNAGAGLMVHLGDTFGARADIKYYRDLEETDPDAFDVDLGGFNYWRGSVGLSLRF